MNKKLKQYGNVLEDVNIKDYNTFKIGGKASYLVKPESSSDVKDLIELLKDENVKYQIIGNGSNLIFSDKDYDGVLIKLDELNAIEVTPGINSVFAEAGAMLSLVAKKALEEGLTGLEWAIGIPGTIGGSIVSNAGAYKSEIFDFVKSVTVIDPDGNLKKMTKDEISHAYRTTLFKETKGYCVLIAELELQKGDAKYAQALIEERRERRVNDQPLEYPSAGSVFRNPDEKEVADIIKKHNLKGPYAGHLIEMCGLKGKQIGGAQISEKHANFIINTGNASANDVKNLIDLAHDEVLKKYGIDLIAEQEFVNWE